MALITVATNAREVAERLAQHARHIPYALKLGINELAKDIIKREQEEMRRVFDRPKPFVLRGLRVSKWATKVDPTALIDFKNVYVAKGGANIIENAMTPHIPGFPGVRAYKGAERWLQRVGYMRAGEYLVPSRTAPLDAYGNVRGPLIQKMLADIGVYRNVAGAPGTTRRARARFVWGAVFGQDQAGSARAVRGIWLVEGGAARVRTNRWHLMMLVVRGVSYEKRFDFYGVAERHVAAELDRFIGAALEQALATAH